MVAQLLKYIPYGRQDIDINDVEEVIKVLHSDFLTQGPMVPNFEESLKKTCEADYATVVNSATSALHIACLALGVEEGDRVWTSPITFVATANAARFCGADIDFVDIDLETFNMCPVLLEEKLMDAERDGTLPKVVIPVHMAGHSCEMEKIQRLSDKFGFSIVEDASHAIGGTYNNKPIGSCSYSDVCVFSFHPVKIITTGEGGAALTNCSDLAEKMNLLRSHGVTRDQSLMDSDSHGGWYYQQLELGFNYRMTDLQAALGVSQLSRLAEFIQRRRQLAQRYDNNLHHSKLELPIESSGCKSSYHLYVMKLDKTLIPKRSEIFSKLRGHGLGVNVHYIPIYLQPYYQKLGFNPGCCPQAEEYYSRAISIPLFPKMSYQEQDQVVKIIHQELDL